MKYAISRLIFSMFPFISLSLAQDSSQIYIYPSSSNFEEKVISVTSQLDLKYKYMYKIFNLSYSEQNIWSFDIVTSSHIELSEHPFGWLYLPGQIEPGLLGLNWIANDSLSYIKPDSSLSGFDFISSGLPSICQYYIQGWVELPIAISEPDSFIGGEEWKRGKMGKTIGPINPPNPFIPLIFLGTLTGYTTQSRSLEWIKGQPTADKYLSYFDSAKTSLQQDSLYAAHKILQQVLQDVDIDSTANITSEAYALLRYNTEYLIDHLPQVTAIMIAQNWNLVSVPLLQSDYSANVVFPGKFGDMFGYNTSLDNYEIAETLLCGAGYWVNYQTSGSVSISGMVPETVSVEATQEGWVLIGSRHIPVQVSSLVLSDGAVINGAAYRYNTATGAYESTPVLNPGEGHWLNVSKACTITFP